MSTPQNPITIDKALVEEILQLLEEKREYHKAWIDPPIIRDLAIHAAGQRDGLLEAMFLIENMTGVKFHEHRF